MSEWYVALAGRQPAGAPRVFNGDGTEINSVDELGEHSAVALVISGGEVHLQVLVSFCFCGYKQ